MNAATTNLQGAVACAVGACYEPWLLGALGNLFQKAKTAFDANDNTALQAVADEFSKRGDEILAEEDGRGVYSPKFYKKEVAFAMAILLRGYATGNEAEAQGSAGFFSCAADFYVTSETEHHAFPELAAEWASRDTAPVWLDKVVGLLT